MRRISLFSNYLNEHMLPLCLAFCDLEDVEFTFVALRESGGNAGKTNMNEVYPFVLREYESDAAAEESMRHALDDDIVIFGALSDKPQYLDARLKHGKLSFRAAERLLKRGLWWRFAPPKLHRTRKTFLQYREAPLYVLCMSAYMGYDLSLSGWPDGRCFRWGYFPAPGPAGDAFPDDGGAKLLWTARMVDWKKPLEALRLAKELKSLGYPFHLTMAGDGPLLPKLEAYVSANGLDDVVDLPGMLPGPDTKLLMARSDIFLATSTREEGWGAAVNEAMGAGCAVVASASMGSAPYLVDDGETGLLYDDLDRSGADLLAKTRRLLDDRPYAQQLSVRAKESINGLWSAGTAATRLVQLADALSEERVGRLFSSGPCSPDPILKDGWYHRR